MFTSHQLAEDLRQLANLLQAHKEFDLTYGDYGTSLEPHLWVSFGSNADSFLEAFRALRPETIVYESLGARAVRKLRLLGVTLSCDSKRVVTTTKVQKEVEEKSAGPDLKAVLDAQQEEMHTIHKISTASGVDAPSQT